MEGGKMIEEKTMTKFSESIERLFMIQERISMMSEAFFVTGNSSMGNKLSHVADGIGESIAEMNEYDRHLCSELIGVANQSHRNMFEGVMAGMQIGAEGEK